MDLMNALCFGVGLFGFLGGVGLGVWLGMEGKPPVRYDHFRSRTTLVLIHTARRQKPVIVQFDDGQWTEAEDVLLEEFSQGTLRLPDLDQVERCRRFLERRIA